MCLRKETENRLSWLQGVKAARLSAERSRKRAGKKERTRANWKVKKEVNVRESGATYETEMGIEKSMCVCVCVCKLMVMCLKG